MSEGRFFVDAKQLDLKNEHSMVFREMLQLFKETEMSRLSDEYKEIKELQNKWTSSCHANSQTNQKNILKKWIAILNV